MKIVFFGDSITDAGRVREDSLYNSYLNFGCGYVAQVGGALLYENPAKYEIKNRGISGNKIADLYARIKRDVWALEPDVVSILVGVNDVWHDDGSSEERYKKIYKAIIEETKQNLPNAKIMLVEPFILDGEVVLNDYERFSKVYNYAKIVKEVAKEYNLPLVLLQQELLNQSSKFEPKLFAYDGVHPTIAGASIIAKEWLKVFKKEIDKEN